MQIETQYQLCPVLDPERLMRAAMGDKTLIREVIKGFQKDMTNMFQEFSDSFDSLDQDAVLARLHKLKGAAGNVGGKRLEALLKVINESVKTEGGLIEYANICAVRSEFESLIVQLEHTFA